MNNRKVIYLDDAIDALERKKDKKAKGDIGGFYNTIIQNDIDTLMQLPSVQPECESGEWIRNDNGTYSCSVCQSWIPEEQHYYARYCLYCGAKMRSKDNG